MLLTRLRGGGGDSTQSYADVKQRQTAVTAYFASKQLLLFAFALYSCYDQYNKCRKVNASLVITDFFKRGENDDE